VGDRACRGRVLTGDGQFTVKRTGHGKKRKLLMSLGGFKRENKGNPKPRGAIADFNWGVRLGKFLTLALTPKKVTRGGYFLESLTAGRFKVKKKRVKKGHSCQGTLGGENIIFPDNLSQKVAAGRK